MTVHPRRAVQALGFGGLLPFIALFAAAFFSWPWPLSITPEQAFFNYSLIIASFMAGILWALACWQLKQQQTTLLFIASGMALLIFIVGCLPSPWSLLGMCLIYALLLLVDFHPQLRAQHWSGYRSMRISLSSIVIMVHILWIVSIY